MKNLPNTGTNFPFLLRKVFALVVSVAMIVLVLMFSMVVFAVILVAGAIAWAYLWWKTRELRKRMRDFASSGAVMGGQLAGNEVARGAVIEGEVIRVDETRDAR